MSGDNWTLSAEASPHDPKERILKRYIRTPAPLAGGVRFTPRSERADTETDELLVGLGVDDDASPHDPKERILKRACTVRPPPPPPGFTPRSERADTETLDGLDWHVSEKLHPTIRKSGY